MNRNDKLVYNIPVPRQNIIKNCYYYRNLSFYYYCESYCSMFNLTRVSPGIEGHVEELYKFVKYFRKHKYLGFKYPFNNLLLNGVIYQENLIIDTAPEVFRDYVFYRPGAAK